MLSVGKLFEIAKPATFAPPAQSPMADTHQYVFGKMAALKRQMAFGRMKASEYNLQMAELRKNMFNKQMGVTQF